jgi:hypothetical protein
MDANELREWLKGDESAGSGWSKDDGSGETIGHERFASSNTQASSVNRVASGGKIVHILEKNPTKDPNEYDEEDVEHMRRVVAYCKRHLAQEEKAKQDPNSKSYK